jgi:hypothetical protein
VIDGFRVFYFIKFVVEVLNGVSDNLGIDFLVTTTQNHANGDIVFEAHSKYSLIPLHDPCRSYGKPTQWVPFQAVSAGNVHDKLRLEGADGVFNGFDFADV